METQQATKKKLLFCDNYLWGLLNFRGYIIQHFINLGYDVLLVAPQSGKDGYIPKGARYIPIEMERCGTNPWADFRYFRALYKIYRRERPDYVFHYTIKPNIYGTLAAHRLGILSAAMIPGLGYAFVGKSFLKMLGAQLYRTGLYRAHRIIVLNKFNYDFILKQKLAPSDHLLLFENGEGVDLTAFPFTDNEDDNCTFLMVSRLLSDKGYNEFVAAARKIKEKYPQFKFQLLGPKGDNNPAAISEEQLEKDVNSGVIEYLGTTDDVQSIVGRPGTVIVLPSYHEGLSRSLMEACAMGKPIITSDIPGCRETVEDGVNGFLVPPQNTTALIEAMQRYIDLSKEEKSAFSKAGRRIAEERFDVRKVAERYEQILAEVFAEK